MKHLLATGLLFWYGGFFLFMAIAPVDPHSWALSSILPILFVGLLALTYRHMPFSGGSYVLFSIFLTLHTIGSHYTYAQVPFGFWMEDFFGFHRNTFDRMVHFSFGLLFAYPLYELFGTITAMLSWLRYYMVFMTIAGLGGLWEILEFWVARIVSPELGPAFLGAQGDLWDAQKDMAATLFGALIGLAIMIIGCTWLRPRPASCKERMVEPASCV